MKFDSIIFDLDGTLWDSTSAVIDIWNETISSYKQVKSKITLEDMKSVMGLVVKDIAFKFFPYLEQEIGVKIINNCFINECEYLEKNGGILYDRLEAILKGLTSNYKLFIVSNCQCGYIEAFLKAHALDKYFVDYESAGRTNLTKGENIKLIMQRNNLKSSVYVGDTQGDLKAARFAGIPFIYASYGFGAVSEQDYVIDKLDELLKL